MKRTYWICRTWIKTTEDGWTSEFDLFETKEEAMEHGRLYKELIGPEDLERDFEIYETELTRRGRYVVRDWNGDLIGRTDSLAKAVEMTTDHPFYWVEDSERGRVLEWRELPN